MNSVEAVKKELRDVKYYYLRKKSMDRFFGETGDSQVIALVKKYSNYIRNAPIRLYDLYCCMYLQNKTQEGVGIEFGYTQEYVRQIHRKLLDYFCECIEKEGGK